MAFNLWFGTGIPSCTGFTGEICQKNPMFVDYADGNFLKKWLAPILRNLADNPQRMAELDVNEGVVDLIEMRFPPPGSLLTPVFPAPTNARTFVILRLLGVLAGVVAKAVDGKMPADKQVVFKDNKPDQISVVNLHWDQLDPKDLTASKAKVERNPKSLVGEHPPLPPVSLSGEKK